MESANNPSDVPDLIGDITKRTIYYATNGVPKQMQNNTGTNTSNNKNQQKKDQAEEQNY